MTKTVEEILAYCKKERALLQDDVDAPAWDEEAWDGTAMASAYENVIEFIEEK